MRSSSFMLILVGVLSACAPSPSEDSPANYTDSDTKRPNIVILFLDDAGYGDFGYTGNPLIRTPNIDRIAAEGMRFTQFYSASPACTASRYALLTGRLPVRSGFGWVLTPSAPRGVHPEEWTLAEGLRDRGYATAIFGKWHLGRPEEYLPLQHGFDEYLGLPYSNDMQPPQWVSLPLIEGNEVVELDPDQTLLTATFTRRAVEFIERERQEPFFLYVPYSMPHLPLMPGAAFAGGSPRGTYGDVIEELDWSIGEIIGAINKSGLAQNTLVFFTSDNGPWIIKNEQGGSAGPFRDGKGSTWEGGMREPGIAWWPGTVPKGSVDHEVATTMDIYVTALQLAGAQVPTDRTVDGHDISPRLRGSSSSGPRNPFYYYGPGQKLHAVRQGPWKMHIMTSSQTGIDYFEAKLPLLFHLERDPGERWDVADQFPEIIEQLESLVSTHLADIATDGSFFDRD